MLTLRQRVLKIIYPLLMFFKGKNKRMSKRLVNSKKTKPLSSFYDLKAIANNGKEISMSDFKGKKILIVNVASNCGYTGQYDELEKIYLENKDKLIVLGFPANDFKNQETGTDKEIEQFCRINYGVTFPLFKKQSVLKPGQEEIFKWLTDEKQNGWNNQEPVWNFSKYIVDENGVLTNFYGTAVSPLSEEVKNSLK
jgi:glutathione peroxidase